MWVINYQSTYDKINKILWFKKDTYFFFFFSILDASYLFPNVNECEVILDLTKVFF